MIRYNIEKDITEDPTLVCTFMKRLDTAICQEIENDLFSKVQNTKIPVVFNMQDVDYVASSFLSICLRVAKKVGTENFSIINVHPNVKKVFKIAKFDKQLTIT